MILTNTIKNNKLSYNINRLLIKSGEHRKEPIQLSIFNSS